MAPSPFTPLDPDPQRASARGDAPEGTSVLGRASGRRRLLCLLVLPVLVVTLSGCAPSSGTPTAAHRHHPHAKPGKPHGHGNANAPATERAHPKGDRSGNHPTEAPHTSQAPHASQAPNAPRPGGLVKTTLAAAVAGLPVAAERQDGYDRDLFTLWSDADSNGCDTREEVLVTENRDRHATLSSYCQVIGGEWRSYYDQVTTSDPSVFDIDHLVPLAEAFASGAYAWSPARREAYANDLGERRALIAVTATSNRTKSDGDPAEWMPTYEKCVYVSSWVAVKTRWHLSVDPAEKRALGRYAASCGPRRTTVRIAKVVGTSTADARPSDSGRMPAGDGQPTTPTTAPVPGSSGNDPRFDYCTSAIAAGYGPYVRGRDPEYAWYTDGDSDGTVCET